MLMNSPDFHYLQDSEVEVEGLKVYGSPWTPWFHDWAFNAQRGEDIKGLWDNIPGDTDILVTHGPPLGHGDRVLYPPGQRVGCEDLLNRVKEIKPRLHVFGHIHEDSGKWDRYWDKKGTSLTTFVNASSCDLSYKADNPPIVVDI
jgi:Icc-related predicted phosphoesterase